MENDVTWAKLIIQYQKRPKNKKFDLKEQFIFSRKLNRSFPKSFSAVDLLAVLLISILIYFLDTQTRDSKWCSQSLWAIDLIFVINVFNAEILCSKPTSNGKFNCNKYINFHWDTFVVWHCLYSLKKWKATLGEYYF